MDEEGKAAQEAPTGAGREGGREGREGGEGREKGAKGGEGGEGGREGGRGGRDPSTIGVQKITGIEPRTGVLGLQSEAAGRGCYSPSIGGHRWIRTGEPLA